MHHSGRGIQYACAAYVQILEKHVIIFSRSRPERPYDNASCESFIKTLKREEIDGTAYRNLEHLRANLEVFLKYYNHKRLHSSLGLRAGGGVRTKQRIGEFFAGGEPGFFQA